MTARFRCTSSIEAPIETIFDLALNIDAHLGSMARSGERAVGGVTSGQIRLGEEVTWSARHFGVRWTMTSRIVDLERPTFFADEQINGPFARFRHEHIFASAEGGTRMIDDVTFEAPFGPFGRVADGVLRRYLGHLIEHRNRYLKVVAERRS
jgi:ligand-binding SRPBCC domain-containing protein